MSPPDPDVVPWKNLNAEEKAMFARQMEVYAAYLSFVDHHIGDLIAFLEAFDQLDNTLIILVSDNGASAEGGPTGSFNENLFFNGVADTVKQNAKHIANWGDPTTYPHYSWGWTHATNTPFRRWKREVARGGTSDLCIIHYPKGFKSKDAIRPQFVHAIDLVPTVLDVCKLKSPTSINGVAQSQIEGVSFAATFDNPNAKLAREAQYFEMFAQRAIYLDGWRAYAPWKFGDNITAKDLAKDNWMLFNIDTDFSESDDLAAKNPAKLEEMKQLWWAMANKYKVLPLDGRGIERFATPRPEMSAPRSKYTYFPGTGEVEASTAVSTHNRSHSITAEVEIPRMARRSLARKRRRLWRIHLLCQQGSVAVLSQLPGSLREGGVEEKVPEASHAAHGFQVTGPPDFKPAKVRAWPSCLSMARKSAPQKLTTRAHSPSVWPATACAAAAIR